MQGHGAPCPLLIDVYHKIVAEGVIQNLQQSVETRSRIIGKGKREDTLDTVKCKSILSSMVDDHRPKYQERS